MDTECSVSGANSQPCDDDPRISISSTRTSCKLMINNPDPDDTGIWKVRIYLFIRTFDAVLSLLYWQWQPSGQILLSAEVALEL